MTDHPVRPDEDPIAGISVATKRFLAGDIGALIGGEEIASTGDAAIDVLDPGTGKLLCRVAAGGAAEVDRAVTAARAAFETWSETAPAERERMLSRIADVVEAHADELAELESLDTGKPLRNARLEVAAAVSCYRYYAGWPTKVYGETNPLTGGLLSYTTREPVGVCGQITPWNYPFMLAAWKIAPALAFGNTVVMKPPEQAPLSTLRLGQLCLETGLPAGAVNVVPGYGPTAGQALVDHPDVDKIAFTGSTEVGKQIVATGSRTLKRVTLELGGKSPNIVFADADLKAASAGAARAIFWNSGQVCVAGSRLFVERSVADELVAAVVERARALRLGHGLAPDTDLGPMVSAEHRERVLGFVEGAAVEGATLAYGGGVPEGSGYFVGPRVFTDVRPEMRIAREEVFGPVLTVIPFDDVDEVVRLANDTRYGLAAAIWTTDLARAHSVARRVRAGTVWVNTFGVLDPSVSFGGFKESGLGRELGLHSIDAYTETKGVYVRVGR